MPSSIIKSFANKTGKSESEVEKLWDKAKSIAKEEYPKISVDSDRYFSIVTGILKKMLKIDEGVEMKNELKEATLSGDIAQTPGGISDLQARFKYDKDYHGMPCFIVNADDYTRMSVARRTGGRYNVQDERVRNFMQQTGYRKPFCVECNGNMVKIDYKTNGFRR